MNHPGIWILGDLDNDDRRHGMGIVVEYSGRTGKPEWLAPPAFKWNYSRFAKPDASPTSPDETFEMTFTKDNAAEEGFNRWTINDVAFPMAYEIILQPFIYIKASVTGFACATPVTTFTPSIFIAIALS